MKKIRLAIIRASRDPLDTSTYNIQELGLAKGLLGLNVSTDFYSRFIDISETTIIGVENECQIRLIPLVGITILGKIAYFPGLVKNLVDYDYIQVHEDSLLMAPLIIRALKKQKVKIILFQGMYTNYSGYKRLYQVLFDYLFKKMFQKNCDLIFAKTELARKYLTAKGYKNVKLLTVGLDYNKEKFKYSRRKEVLMFKSRFNKCLLYVGKIEPRRNPLFLVDILVSLIEKGLNICLIVVGNGPMEPLFIDYANKKNVTGNLLLIKSVPNNEIFDIFEMGDIMLLPTNHEIYGMVILEALVNGVPVIATPEAGPLSILHDIRLGRCLPLDVKKWVEVIEYYSNEKNSQGSRHYRIQKTKEIYSWNAIAKNYYKYITENRK